MPLIVDDPKIKKPNNLFNIIVKASDYIGSILYKETKIDDSLKTFYSKLYNKLPKRKSPTKKSHDVSTLKDVFDDEKQMHRFVGGSIVFIIILITLSIIYTIINYIISELFNIMEWWVVAIVFIVVLTPICLSIAYSIAKGEY